MFSAQREFVSDPVAAFSVVGCVDFMNVLFPMWDYAMGYFDTMGSKIDAIVAEAIAHDWISRKVDGRAHSIPKWASVRKASRFIA